MSSCQQSAASTGWFKKEAPIFVMLCCIAEVVAECLVDAGIALGKLLSISLPLEFFFKR